MPIIPDVGSQDAEVVLINSIENVGITFRDNSDTDTDPQALSLEIHDLNGSEILTDIYLPLSNRDPNPPRIINSSVGRYEFQFGLDNGSTDTTKKNKTTQRCDYLFTWRAKQIASVNATVTIDPGIVADSRLDWTAVYSGSPGNFISVEYVDPGTSNATLSVVRTNAKITINLATNVTSNVITIANDIIAAVQADESSSEIVTVTTASGSDGSGLVAAVSETNLANGSDGSEEDVVCVNVKIINQRICSLVGKLRLLIDKAIKCIIQTGDINESVYLGYSEGQLLQFIEDGLQIINAYQPSGQFTLDNYPYTQFEFTLVECALMAGVMSQQLFAIDTDVPNWNDQGNAFVIQHQPQLAQFLNWISQRLDRMIPQMKLNFVSSGSLHVQAGPNFRLATLIASAPSGALFRNTFFRSV